MAKHIVKCPYCNKEFDASKEPYVLMGRRYAHKTCYDEAKGEKPVIKRAKRKSNSVVTVPPKKSSASLISTQDTDLKALKDYIDKLFGENCNWPMTMKYIKKFKNENKYSYSGMLKSLIYFFEVQGNSIEKANNSIGIIPFVYQDAYKYYFNIYLAQRKNKDINNYKAEIQEITIPSPRMPHKKIKLFNLDDLKGDNE